MSAPTVAQQGYEIRDGSTSFGEGRQGPMVEGRVGSTIIALAFQTPPDEHGRTRWLRAHLTNQVQPRAAMSDGEHARRWVAEVTAQHAKDIATQRVS